ncbi:pterin 4 alpha carbinolamine dehydratase-domain-containing protein [Phyllosticta citricarpa]|uniref:4a-hydroxytetrahydrobiopterin dehydratase n=2 Tax=Phyllosticta TaxID=121621 RepID=A0ABR1LHH7_9PEZI
MPAFARIAGPQSQCLKRLIPQAPRSPILCPRRSGGPNFFHASQSRRAFCSSSSIQMAPKFAPGSDEGLLAQQTQALVQEHGWELDQEEMGLLKTFNFKTYTKALDFLNVIGVRSKSRSHHATMTIKPSSVDVHWTTHVPRGLSSKDIDMARYCEEQAAEIGTVEKGQGMNCRTGKAPTS